MNDIYKNIIERRSIKKYKDIPVPFELVEKIAQAGSYAPNGRGNQSPIIIAVTDKALRDELSKINADIMSSDTDPFYGAPCVIVVLADKRFPTYIYDGSLVMEILCLAQMLWDLARAGYTEQRRPLRAKEERQYLKGSVLRAIMRALETA